MDITQEDLINKATSGRQPIAGQSLVEDPAATPPYQRPPRFTVKEEAVDYFLEYFLEPERYEAIMDSLEEGTTVMELVSLFLMEGFRKGDFNPDLMMLLAEPLAYIIIGLSERAGIKVTIVDDDPDDPDDFTEEEDDEEEEIPTDIMSSKLKTIKNPQDDKDFSIENKLNNLPSLMAKGEG
jgi:hypothetical protein